MLQQEGLKIFIPFDCEGPENNFKKFLLIQTKSLKKKTNKSCNIARNFYE
jgi:hypothetical protein